MLHNVSIEVLEIFVEASRLGRRRHFDKRPIHYVDTAWAGGKTSRRRLEIRRERSAARPPCPQCGAPVVRCGLTAKIPRYCSRKCMRAATFARWYAKHGAKRNVARRKTNRASPHKGEEKETGR